MKPIDSDSYCEVVIGTDGKVSASANEPWWTQKGYAVISDTGIDGEPGRPLLHTFVSTRAEAQRKVDKLEFERPADLRRRVRIVLAVLAFADARCMSRGWQP